MPLLPHKQLLPVLCITHVTIYEKNLRAAQHDGLRCQSSDCPNNGHQRAHKSSVNLLEVRIRVDRSPRTEDKTASRIRRVR
jgi:hypothetical protein